MKIKDKINIKDNLGSNKKPKTPVKGKIKIKNKITGEVIYEGNNLIVNNGRNFIKSSISHDDTSGKPVINSYKDFIAYFKVGSVKGSGVNDIQTVLTDSDLNSRQPLGQSISASELINPVFTNSSAGINKFTYDGPYGQEQYIIKTTNGSNSVNSNLDAATDIIGKCPTSMSGALSDITTTDFILFELTITPADISATTINELGLFLLRFNDISKNPGVNELEYAGDESGSELMFSRVTFDNVNMDGQTEYTIEYYLYI